MSLYGALNIGVAGLSANSAALSATSSNIANVNTVGYKEATASFSTFLNAEHGVGSNASAGVAVSVGQDITTQGLPTTTSSPTDLSISGNGFFVVTPNRHRQRHPGIYPRRQLHAGCQRQSGQRRRPLSAGLQAGLRGQCAHQRQRAQPGQCHRRLSGTAQATSTLTRAGQSAGQLDRRCRLYRGRHDGRHGDAGFHRAPSMSMTARAAASRSPSPSSRPRANTWAYEASYAGNSANLTATGPIRPRHDRVQFRRHAGQCRTARRRPRAHVNMTIPWKLSTSGLNPQTISLNLGTVGGSDGLTQADAPSVLNGSTIDGSAYGSVTGVTVAQGRHRDGAVLQRPVAGRLQNSARHLHQSGRAGPDVGQCLCRDQDPAARPTSTWPIPAAPAPSSPNRWKARPSIWPPSSPI